MSVVTFKTEKEVEFSPEELAEEYVKHLKRYRKEIGKADTNLYDIFTTNGLTAFIQNILDTTESEEWRYVFSDLYDLTKEVKEFVLEIIKEEDSKDKEEEKYKVVYNACYGGFGISDEAVRWLEIYGSVDVRNFLKEKRVEIIKNRGEGDYGFGTIENILSYSLFYEYKGKGMPRHHDDLVAVVEALGKEANGMYSDLMIAELTNNTYRIDDYDGMESVVTPDDYEWIVIG